MSHEITEYGEKKKLDPSVSKVRRAIRMSWLVSFVHLKRKKTHRTRTQGNQS